MWKYNPTLTSRVTLWVTLLSLFLFLILSFLTVMITLSSEDAMIHNILRNVSQEKLLLGHHAKEISIDELFNIGYDLATKTELSNRIGGFGEFPAGDKYYHFMVLPDKILLLDSTTFVASEARIKAIIQFLFKAFIPFLIIAFIVSKVIAKRALKPFDILKASFIKTDKLSKDIRKVNQDIKEADVKQIADELVLALEQKEQVLAQQIAFNQGVSHELRTPLQVMIHAIEFIGLKNPDVVAQDAYQRLINALGRMHRTSEAMLWLTSTTKTEHVTEVNLCLHTMKQEILQTFSQQGLRLRINEKASLKLPVPEDVFEFILYNLANNVVHHASEINGEKLWDIQINAKQISFSNSIDVNEVTIENPVNHFGLGLSIISKLCKRFGLSEKVLKGRSSYVINIRLN